MNQTPNNNPNDADSWIVYGMFHDMTDTGEPTSTGVTDNVNGYTMAQVFRGLRPEVTEVREYQQLVLSQNSNRQAAEMNQLLTSYRWQ